MNKKLKIGVSTLLIIVGIVSAISFSKQSFGLTLSTPLRGYAWSDYVGWMDLSSKNCDRNGNGQYDSGDAAPSGCPSSGTAPTFGVSRDAAGILSGYAWSDHIGWISFNETSGCPGGVCQPRIVGSSMQGWAKARVADGNGWDGWISLGRQAGDTVNYGPTLSGTTYSGFPWGAEVVGWVDFSLAVDEGPVSSTCGIANGVPSAIPPAVGLCASGATPTGVTTNATNYTWQCNVIGISSDSCSAPRIGLPINGQCGVATNTCTAGTYVDVADDASNYRWRCDGIDGGTPASCTSPITVVNDCRPDISTYRLSPPIVETPTDRCSLGSITVTNVGTGVCQPGAVTCRIDSGTAFVVPVGGPFTPTGVDMSIGTHTITCTDSVSGNSDTSNPAAKCLLNPDYGEF